MQRKQNNIWANFGNGKNLTKKKWINNMEQESQGLEEGPKAPLFKQSNIQKVPSWKTPGYDDIYGFRFKKLRQTGSRNEQMLRRKRYTRMGDLRKEYPDPKRP